VARVSNLFARRAYNIFSLAVAPTQDERFSRITIVVDVKGTPLDQISKQLYKLIDVIAITELYPGEAVERELLLATISTSGKARAAKSWSWFSVQRTHRRRRPRCRHGDAHLRTGDHRRVSKTSSARTALASWARTGRVALAKLEKQAPVALAKTTKKAG